WFGRAHPFGYRSPRVATQAARRISSDSPHLVGCGRIPPRGRLSPKPPFGPQRQREVVERAGTVLPEGQVVHQFHPPRHPALRLILKPKAKRNSKQGGVLLEIVRVDVFELREPQPTAIVGTDFRITPR